MPTSIFTTEPFTLTVQAVVAQLPRNMADIYSEENAFNLVRFTALVGESEALNVLTQHYQAILRQAQVLAQLLILPPVEPLPAACREDLRGNDSEEESSSSSSSPPLRLFHSSSASSSPTTSSASLDSIPPQAPIDLSRSIQSWDEQSTQHDFSQACAAIQTTLTQYLPIFIAGITAVGSITSLEGLTVDVYKSLHSFIESIEQAGYALDEALLNMADISQYLRFRASLKTICFKTT